MREHMPPSRFAKRSDAVSAIVVAAHLALVLAPIYLAASLGFGWWLLPCWLWFGLTMNGLLNLMHETAHFHVFRARAANDLLGRWILGPLSLADFDAYRQRHWDHHRRLGQPDDPKLTYHTDIHGPRLAALALRCLTLVEAARKFRHQTHAPDDDEPAPGNSLGWIVRVLIVHALFAASILAAAWLGHPGEAFRALLAAALAYAFVYIYGLAGLTVFAASLRAIAEHQIGPDGSSHVGAAALRNFSCNPFTRLVLGAYGFGEHATHHQQPAIPYYRLQSATAELAAKDPALAPFYGYWSTLRVLSRPSAPTAAGAAAR
jgi:fatty acid desaturase